MIQIIFGAFLNSGQICMSTERVIVHASLAEEFEVALKEAMKSIQDRQFDLIRPGAVTELRGLLDGATSQVSLSPSCPLKHKLQLVIMLINRVRGPSAPTQSYRKHHLHPSSWPTYLPPLPPI
jgi:hypothetical protein